MGQGHEREPGPSQGVLYLPARCKNGPFHHRKVSSHLLVLPALHPEERQGRYLCQRKKVNTPHEALSVARTMDALGTGVTGGEPLLVLERVLSFCRELKGEFGKDHHIHLYTGRPPREMSSGYYPASWTRSVCTLHTRNGSRLERVHFSIQ